MRIPRGRARRADSDRAPEYWTDPAAFAIGRRPGRALLDRFDSLADLDAGNRTNRLALDGDWDFEWVDGLVDFDGHEAAARGPRGGGTIPVPGAWQLHGYGIPRYLAMGYPPGVGTRRIPSIDQRRNEAGVYGRTFAVPADWVGRRRVSVVFDGVKAGLLLYVNGREVGYAQGSFSPAEFDLTDHLVPGPNRLTAVVWRHTDGTYLEDQDMWFLSGIVRPVYLLAEPPVSMADLWVRTELDHSYRDGTIRVEVQVANAGASPVHAQVDLLLRSPGSDDRVPAGSKAVRVPRRSSRVVGLVIAVPDALTWTAETPHLYEVTAVLRHPEPGDTIQVATVRTGIRVVEIRDRQFLVNGVPIRFFGVNRHDVDPDHAWAVPEARRREDLLIAKRLNVNAIRCAHYPNPQHLYDQCDELGLYVIDECDLETHGIRRRNVPGDNPTWTAAVVDRMQRMVAADRNHPSIVMWSLGNEAGLGGDGGGNFARMRAVADAMDGTRPYHYEGDHQPGVSDVISRMYATAEELATLGRGEALTFGPVTALTNLVLTDAKDVRAEWLLVRPVLLCEFAHAMGNSLGDFAEYMDVFDTYPSVLGGFVWDFADQSLNRPAADGSPRWLYGGDFGDRPSHRYFCNNGLLGPDRREHPHARELHWGYRPMAVDPLEPATGRYRVRNRTSFTPGSAFAVMLELRRDGALVLEQELDAVDVAPGATVEWIVPKAVPPADPEDAGTTPEWVARVLFRTTTDSAWAPAGWPVGSDEFVLTPLPDPTGSDGSGRDADQGVTDPVRRALLAVAEAAGLAERAGDLAGRPGELASGAARGMTALTERLAGRLGPATESARRPTAGADPVLIVPDERPAGVTWTSDRSGWKLHTPGATLRVDRHSGWLRGWRIAAPEGGRDVLSGPLRPTYWRALTDNDRGYGNIDSRLQHLLVDPAWRDARPIVVDSRITVDRTGVTLRLTLECPLFRSGVLQYTIRADGSVDVHHRLVPDREMFRLGLTTRLPELEVVRWYGKGPHENYVDRNHGAVTAVHELPLDQIVHRYVRPQENGNRTEVRWLEAVAPGIVLRAEDLTGERLGFTAWPWTQEHLDATEHDHDLIAGREVTLTVDRRQRGVGGDIPGVAALLPGYTIPAGHPIDVTMRLSARVR